MPDYTYEGALIEKVKRLDMKERKQIEAMIDVLLTLAADWRSGIKRGYAKNTENAYPLGEWEKYGIGNIL